VNLSIGKAHPERVEQLAQLCFVDLAVLVAVDALEALTQRITHSISVRGFARVTKMGALSLFSLAACRANPDVPAKRGASVELPAPAPLLHPPASRDPGGSTEALPALGGSWLVELKTAESPVFIAPPLGATAPRPVLVGVHGAGDRPEWSCGGWRLASQASVFVVCPTGTAMGPDKFAWVSSAQLGERLEQAIDQTRQRFGTYFDAGPMIFAGFSQGATLAEPFLLKHAQRFPIAILAEGGYATAQRPSFARAYREAGGRRVVLVCGGPSCFISARSAQKVLERAGLEALVVGDPKAGHNLNERMQKALQAAWPNIAAPLAAAR
jgi:predicted esterase